MFGALIIGKIFSHINHIGNGWKCHGDDRHGDDAPNLYLTMALPNYNAWRGFEVYVLRVNYVFASLSKNVKNCMN